MHQKRIMHLLTATTLAAASVLSPVSALADADDISAIEQQAQSLWGDGSADAPEDTPADTPTDSAAEGTGDGGDGEEGAEGAEGAGEGADGGEQNPDEQLGDEAAQTVTVSLDANGGTFNDQTETKTMTADDIQTVSISGHSANLSDTGEYLSGAGRIGDRQSFEMSVETNPYEGTDLTGYSVLANQYAVDYQIGHLYGAEVTETTSEGNKTILTLDGEKAKDDHSYASAKGVSTAEHMALILTPDKYQTTESEDTGNYGFYYDDTIIYVDPVDGDTFDARGYLPEKDGKVFAGWADSIDGEVYTGAITADMTLYAVWADAPEEITAYTEEATMTYQFAAEEGTLPDEVMAQLPQDAKAAIGSTYTPDSSAFHAVETDDGTWTFSKFDEPSVVVTADMTSPHTITGYWTFVEKAKIATYEIRYEQENVEQTGYDEVDKVTLTMEAGVDPQPDMKQYTGFTYETTEMDGQIVHVRYKRNSYMLSYDNAEHVSFAGSAAAGKYVYGKTLKIKAVPDNGYTFVQWSTGDKQAQTSFVVPAADTVLGATVKQAETPAPSEKPSDKPADNPSDPSKDDSKKEDETVKYTVRYCQQNANGKGYTVVEKTTINGTAARVPSPARKKYDGFTLYRAQLDKSNKTLINVLYNRNQHKLSYETSKKVQFTGSSEAGTYYYGAKITLKAVPAKGYDLKSWSTGSKDPTTTFTMPDEDVTISAKVTPHKYKITYNLDGGTAVDGSPAEYTIESETFALVAPTKAGFTFAGWTGANGNTPQLNVRIGKGTAADLTFTAHWTTGEVGQVGQTGTGTADAANGANGAALSDPNAATTGAQAQTETDANGQPVSMSNVQTGDESPLGMMAMLFGMSAAMLLGVGVMVRRKRVTRK